MSCDCVMGVVLGDCQIWVELVNLDILINNHCRIMISSWKETNLQSILP